MRIHSSKRRPSAIIWLFLSTVILLSCLLPPSLRSAGSVYTGISTASLQCDGSVGSEYPDFIHEMPGGEQNLFLLSSSATQRIPLRLPVPHMWISYVLLIYNGLRLLHKERIRKRNEYRNLWNYLIRYIHDQDGEIYHLSFLI